MLSRGIAFCSILALTTVAQGGVQVQLVPVFCPGAGDPPCVGGLCNGGTRNGLCCAPTTYAPSSVVQVDVKLAKSPAAPPDELLRMVEFDMQNTSTSLGIVFPLTHDKDTPGTGDDINFWTFSSLPNCATTPSFCGFKHFTDFRLNVLAGAVDTRLNMLSMAFFGLSADGPAQILLAASGTPVTVGKLQATLPVSAGNYTLNMMNSGDPGADRGARVDFGFDPHSIWRDRPIPPDPVQVTGGTLVFNVGASTVCAPTGGPSVLTWESVITHTRAGQTDLIVPLPIPDDSTFCESRTGVKKIVVTFDGPLNPATVIPGNVTICGNLGPGPGVTPVNPGDFVTTAGIVPGSGDMKMEINFAARLTDFARYRIVLKTTILGAGGGAIQAGAGGLSRILTALQGDLNGDRRVNATDVGGIRSLVPRDPINPAIVLEVRGDVNNDKRINATDVGGARTQSGKDARTIPDPVCP